MLCTLKLFTPDTNQVDLAYIERNCGKVTELATNDGYLSYKVKIRNFQFNWDSYGLHLEGSAARFLHEHNIQTLKHHEIPPFIDELSHCVGFDVSAMKITRIDITDNMVMDKTPRVYKRFLGKCRYFQRTDFGNNGLQYLNKSRSLLFYDKLLEMQNKGSSVPVDYIGKNLLRYEYSIRKHRKEHLGHGIQTLADLLHPVVYLTLIDKWEAMFNQIQKISYQSNVAMPYKAGMKVKDWMCLRGVQLHGGMDKAFQDFDEYEALGHITERQRDYLKRTLTSYQDSYNALQNAPGDLKEELVQKLRTLADENRRMI